MRFLVHGAERSGPPIYVLRLLRHWAAEPPPFRPTVVLARPGQLADEFRAVADTTIARLDPGSPEQSLERALQRVGAGGVGRRLSGAATRHRAGDREADLTVVNGATRPTVALLRSLRPTGPVLTIAHELSTGWFANLDPSDRRLLLERSSGFLAVSRSVERFLVDELGVAPSAVTVAHPPIAERELGEPTAAVPGPLTVVGSGMTDWRKAPEIWLRVASELMGRLGSERLRFMWMGGAEPGSPAFWPLRHELRHLGLEGHVDFLGQIDSPSDVLRSAAVFVSTAREDAYPLACAEALGHGVPVVGFDGDGVGEMVRASGGGAVVAYPHHERIVDEAAALLTDPLRRADVGARGRAFALEHLDVAVIAPKVSEWIQGARR